MPREGGASAITFDGDHGHLEATPALQPLTHSHHVRWNMDEHRDASQASTCRVIRVGKLKFAQVVGMNLSKKRQDLLALSERPNQIDTWMQELGQPLPWNCPLGWRFFFDVAGTTTLPLLRALGMCFSQIRNQFWTIEKMENR